MAEEEVRRAWPGGEKEEVSANWVELFEQRAIMTSTGTGIATEIAAVVLALGGIMRGCSGGEVRKEEPVRRA